MNMFRILDFALYNQTLTIKIFPIDNMMVAGIFGISALRISILCDSVITIVAENTMSK